jgi:hypothetical protein
MAALRDDDAALEFTLAPVGLRISRQRGVQRRTAAFGAIFGHDPAELHGGLLENLYPPHDEFEHTGAQGLPLMGETGVTSASCGTAVAGCFGAMSPNGRCIANNPSLGGVGVQGHFGVAPGHGGPDGPRAGNRAADRRRGRHRADRVHAGRQPAHDRRATGRAS